MAPTKPCASLSLDLDDYWAYLKVHGNPKWEEYPSYLSVFIPLILDILKRKNLRITFFIVGQDAKLSASKAWIREIVLSGHEVGNHSLEHEPWMDERTEEEIFLELKDADEAIRRATDLSPVGFRGPGFCCDPKILNCVSKIGYQFDASLLPTLIGPLARAYYLTTLPRGNPTASKRRKHLFGKLGNGFKPIVPFNWKLKQGTLLEIPVTTLPLFRLPFHLSYVIWLSKFSRSAALGYFESALGLCKILNVEPSLLLHPLDFLGVDDAPELAFFPGMDLPRMHKLDIATAALKMAADQFELLPMSEHAAAWREKLGAVQQSLI